MIAVFIMLGVIIFSVLIPILLQYFIFSKKNMDDFPAPIFKIYRTNELIELILKCIMLIIVGLFVLFHK